MLQLALESCQPELDRILARRRLSLRQLPLLENSDDFVFDNEMLAQCIFFGYRIGEISCPTKSGWSFPTFSK